jgi:arginyl-tRNA synthetase
MADPQKVLEQRLSQAIVKAFGAEHAGVDPLVRASANAQFGDFQANAAMSLGKQLGSKPRDVAQQVVDALEVGDLCQQVDIAGPGFINLRLREDYLGEQATRLSGDATLGVQPPAQRQRVVVDYSSPNVAKEMHVGHIRSTIIGDTLVRVLGRLGHEVIRQNHVGDWGTQFGMLIEHLRDLGVKPGQASMPVSDLNALYQDAKRKFDEDAAFADRSRARVVALQAGDADTVALWQQLVRESYHHFTQVYERLGVLLGEADIRGESFYNPQLAGVVQTLERAGLLQISQGAAVVFPPGFADKEGQPLPFIVRKSDGGYLYATTDLAAARYRIEDLKAQRIIYVTDSRQAQHFAMLFAVLGQAGWSSGVRLDHVAFGSILGADRRPFKTREGGTVRLLDLLDEAEQRALQAVMEKGAELSPQQQRQVARTVGIGALKYADLSSDRIKDYVFDWGRMLALEGNTAPYLQNAYVRIRSIFRKGAVDAASLSSASITVAQPAERALALKLLQFGSVVASVAESLEPHRLCTYLYELATGYHQFYEQCPVLKADDAATRASRLRLSDTVARTLADGLGLLGIGTVEQM